jgi:hypothetical protein
MVAAVVVGNHNVNNPSGGFTHSPRYEFARSRNMVVVVGGRTRTQPHVASTSGPKWSRDVEKMVVSRDRMLTPTPERARTSAPRAPAEPPPPPPPPRPCGSEGALRCRKAVI